MSEYIWNTMERERAEREIVEMQRIRDKLRASGDTRRSVSLQIAALDAEVESLSKRAETKQPDVSQITRGIIDDLTARDLKGQREYGQTMDRDDLTPLEWLDHEYAEILDAAQYNRAARRKVEAMTREIKRLRETEMVCLKALQALTNIGGTLHRALRGETVDRAQVQAALEATDWRKIELN